MTEPVRHAEDPHFPMIVLAIAFLAGFGAHPLLAFLFFLLCFL